MKFKRDIIFDQFTPEVVNLKALDVPRSLTNAALVRMYETTWSKDYVRCTAEAHNMPLVKENDKAAHYAKVDRGYVVILIYNKNDCSILISIGRARKGKKKHHK